MDKIKSNYIQYLEVISPIIEERVKLYQLFSELYIMEGQVKSFLPEDINKLDQKYVELLDYVKQIYFQNT